MTARVVAAARGASRLGGAAGGCHGRTTRSTGSFGIIDLSGFAGGGRYRAMKIMPWVTSAGPVSSTGVSAPAFMFG